MNKEFKWDEKIISVAINKKDINFLNSLDKRGDTALMAAGLMNLEIFKLVLNTEGVDVNAINHNNQTMLIEEMYLAPNPTIVDLLLQHKDLDINKKDNSGHTALMIASRYNPEYVGVLLKHPDIDVFIKANGVSALNICEANIEDYEAENIIKSYIQYNALAKKNKNILKIGTKKKML